MIRWMYAFIDRPAPVVERARRFWTTVTGTHLSPPRGAHDEFATLLGDDADACLKVQAVGEGGGIHVDLCVEDVPRMVDAAVSLGASAVTRNPTWAVLRSPGGLLWCAVPWHGESARPAPFASSGGATSRVDQIMIDAGPDDVEAEMAFWAGMTGWESRPSARPEFHLIKPPATMPLRLMVQRLGTQRPTSAHLDLACADVDAVTSWHVTCGAIVVDRRPLWTVMRDPSGYAYCLTAREPETGTLPDWALRLV
jgi:Glyoxalase-like domain